MARRLSFAVAALCASVTVAHAKTDPAKEKAATSAEFAKLVTRWDAAKKTGPLKGDACQSMARDFTKFGEGRQSAEGYFDAGVILEGCGDFKHADAAYRDALRVNPKFAPAMVNLGEMAYRADDFDAARQQFDAARAADPRNVHAYNGIALMIFERARQTNDQAGMKEAIGLLRRALALDADSIAAYSLLALIYYNVAEADRSKLDLAELVCKQAKEVNDKYPQIYNTLGLIKLRKKNLTGALQDFRTAVQLDPRYVEAQLNIGAITLNARDYKSAEEAFRAVLDARPRDPAQLFDATMGMGVALRGERRIDEAEQWYSKAKTLNPKDCGASYNLGVLYQDYRSNAEADLTRAKTFFGDYSRCPRAESDKAKDATRRMKDIDDTFKAIAEQKKVEEENKKLQEEQEKLIKQEQEQKQKAAAPATAPAAPGDAPAEKAPASTPGATKPKK